MFSEESLHSDALRELALNQLRIERDFLDWLPASVGYTYVAASIVLSLFRPKLGFLLIAFSLFFRFQDRIPQLMVFPIFLIQLLSLVVGIALSYKRLQLRLTTIDKWLLSFALVSSMGVLLRHQQQFFNELTAYMSSLIIFFSASWLVNTKSDLHRMMWSIAAGITCMALEVTYALHWYNAPNPFWLTLPSGEPSRLQSIGYFANSNDFGFILNLGFALWLSIFFYSKKWYLKVLYLALIGVNLYLVTLTLSRSQMLTSVMIVPFAMILLLRGKMKKKLIYMASISALLVAVVMHVPGPVKDRLDTIRQGPDGSMEGRFNAWDQGFYMLNSYQIFGWGRQQWGSYHSLAAHNGYVQILGETGLTGAGIFLGFLWLLIRPLLRFNQLSDAQDRRLYVGMITVLICLLSYFMLGNVTYSTITYLIFSMVAVLGRLIDKSISTHHDLSAVEFSRPKFRSQWMN